MPDRLTPWLYPSECRSIWPMYILLMWPILWGSQLRPQSSDITKATTLTWPIFIIQNRWSYKQGSTVRQTQQTTENAAPYPFQFPGSRTSCSPTTPTSSSSATPTSSSSGPSSSSWSSAPASPSTSRGRPPSPRSTRRTCSRTTKKVSTAGP